MNKDVHVCRQFFAMLWVIFAQDKVSGKENIHRCETECWLQGVH